MHCVTQLEPFPCARHRQVFIVCEPYRASLAASQAFMLPHESMPVPCFAVLLTGPATHLMSSGGSASYVKGPLIVARSCVPMATSVRCLHRFWCSLSCRSMKLLYLWGAGGGARGEGRGASSVLTACCSLGSAGMVAGYVM